MARFIAPLDPNCSQNVGRSAVASPAKRRSLADINYQCLTSFTQSARFGPAVSAVNRRFWRIAIAIHCCSPLKTESRRSRFRRSVAAPMVIRFGKQRGLPLKQPANSSRPTTKSTKRFSSSQVMKFSALISGFCSGTSACHVVAAPPAAPTPVPTRRAPGSPVIGSVFFLGFSLIPSVAPAVSPYTDS